MQSIAAFLRTASVSRLLRALGSGGAGVAAQTLVFELLSVWTSVLPASTAVIVGAEAGILTNFYFNNRYSFRDRVGNDSLVSRLVRFHAVVSGSVLIQWLLVFATERATSDVGLIHLAYFAGIGLGFVWNYSLYHYIVWRKQAAPPENA